MKSEMGKMSETLKAMKNSATECGGQFQKGNHARFMNSLSQANF